MANAFKAVPPAPWTPHPCAEGANRKDANSKGVEIASLSKWASFMGPYSPLRGALLNVTPGNPY
jgi:hypothetical protein